MKALVLLFTSFSISVGCSSKKACVHEIEYSQLADSVKTTFGESDFSALKNQELIRDFRNLSCAEFKEKHKLTDKELTVAMREVRTSLFIVDAFKAIENNIKLANENEYERSEMPGEENDGLNENDREERDSLIRIFMNSDEPEKSRAAKALEKFPSEYSFKPKQ